MAVTNELSNPVYLKHLEQLSTQSGVVLTEDLFNERGVLVQKKGVRLDQDLMFKVVKHKLAKPIDLSVSLSEVLSPSRMLSLYAETIQKLGIRDIISQCATYEEVASAFQKIAQYPSVMQKLSVLEKQFPETFLRALCASSLAIGLCKELGLSNEETEHVFIASMLSDVGLLHIEPAIVKKAGHFSAQEWQIMQGHVAIAKCFADHVDGLPKSVGRILLEHHERADGLGYPFAKHHEQLCIGGQVLAIADKICALAQRLVRAGRYSWRAILYVMQVPSTAYFPVIHDATIRLLKRVRLPFSAAYQQAQYQDVIVCCLRKRNELQSWFDEFSIAVTVHKACFTIAAHFSPMELIDRLRRVIENAGLLDASQQAWLESLSTSLCSDDFPDIEEYELLLDEIQYRCAFVIRKLSELTAALPDAFNQLMQGRSQAIA